jgi:hypothetical protein
MSGQLDSLSLLCMEVGMLHQVCFHELIQNFKTENLERRLFNFSIHVSFTSFQKPKFYFTVKYCFYFGLHMGGGTIIFPVLRASKGLNSALGVWEPSH